MIAALMTASAEAWPRRHEQKARVHFLATSTLIRGTWGENEDTHLAQLVLPRQNEDVLVCLVDKYPNEGPPLSRAVLQSDIGTVLPVRRDAECDRPFGEILLRAAPGDLLAILPERLSYRPPLEYTPAPTTIFTILPGGAAVRILDFKRSGIEQVTMQGKQPQLARQGKGVSDHASEID